MDTAVGTLRRVWVYDKVPPPPSCVTCGSTSNLQPFSFEYSADQFSYSAEEIFSALFHIRLFLKRLFVVAVEATGDCINVTVMQCGRCRIRIESAPVLVDLDNRRAQVLACDSFAKLVSDPSNHTARPA